MGYSILLIFILLFVSGFFSGAEIAFFSLGKGQIRNMVESGLRGAKTVEKLKSRPRRLLATILIGNNLANIGAAAMSTDIAIRIAGSIGVGIATGVVTILVLIFGEIFPKSWAQTHAKFFARMSARPLLALEYVFFPIVVLFEHGMKHFIHTPREDQQKEAEGEIRALMEVGVEEGSMEDHEKELVEKVFRFNDVLVGSVMTPLGSIAMLESDAIIEQCAHFAAHSGYSRFPVYDGSKENILGFVHIKDIARANNSDDRDEEVTSIMEFPNFVQDIEPIDEVFKQFRKKHIRQAMVKNKKGRVVGMLTIEDMLEELVGEVFDEPYKPNEF